MLSIFICANYFKICKRNGIQKHFSNNTYIKYSQALGRSPTGILFEDSTATSEEIGMDFFYQLLVQLFNGVSESLIIREKLFSQAFSTSTIEKRLYPEERQLKAGDNHHRTKYHN